MQITENVKAYCRTSPGIPLHERITEYQPLLTTTPMGFRYYHLQPYYYPHGLQVLPPSALQTTTP